MAKFNDLSRDEAWGKAGRFCRWYTPIYIIVGFLIIMLASGAKADTIPTRDGLPPVVHAAMLCKQPEAEALLVAVAQAQTKDDHAAEVFAQMVDDFKEQGMCRHLPYPVWVGVSEVLWETRVWSPVFKSHGYVARIGSKGWFTWIWIGKKPNTTIIEPQGT